MVRMLLSCGLVLLACGCKDEHPEADSTGLIEEQAQDVAAPDDVETPPTAAAMAETAEPSAPGTPAVAVPPPRDLASELREALGSPLDCIEDYQPASPKKIRVSITAVVRPTGMIIEPNASAAGLSANDVRCIEERIGAVILQPLAGQGSEHVATSVEIDYEPPAVEAYRVSPPPPESDSVVHSLPKKEPIAPSGVPIDGPEAEPIDGPDGVPIDGPDAVEISGPKGVPIGSQ
jgi:hypothetical protein